MTIRTKLLAAAVVAMVVAAIAFHFTTGQRNTPAYATVPATLALTATCRPNPDLSYGTGRGRVWVDPNPTSAVIWWVPGFNDHLCRSARTTADAARASQMAAEVEHSTVPPWAHGRWNCPASSGSMAFVFFNYANETKAEVVEVHLTGCPFIANSPSRIYALTDRTRELLQPIAPSQWRHYFG